MDKAGQGRLEDRFAPRQPRGREGAQRAAVEAFLLEEQLHGPTGDELEKQSTTSTEKSVEDEDNDKKL